MIKQALLYVVASRWIVSSCTVENFGVLMQ